MLRHPLDALVNDPSGRPALCGATEFDALLQEMARESAPRLFAVMQEYGDRVDAQIAAWGLAFEDHADVISDNNTAHFGLSAPDDVLRFFHFGSHIRPRLVWVC